MKSFLQIVESKQDFNIKNDVEKIVHSVYNRIKSSLNKRFEDGYATCTFASYELGKELTKHGIDFSVISGDFKGSGHYWIVCNVAYSVKSMKYTREILDIGDNISSSSLNSGKIPLKILPVPNPDYKPEDYLTFKKFASLYEKKLKNF